MRLFISLAFAVSLAACGQTGPLYLPGHEPGKHAGGAQSKPQDSSTGAASQPAAPAASTSPTVPPPPTSVSPSATAPAN